MFVCDSKVRWPVGNRMHESALSCSFPNHCNNRKNKPAPPHPDYTKQKHHRSGGSTRRRSPSWRLPARSAPRCSTLPRRRWPRRVPRPPRRPRPAAWLLYGPCSPPRLFVLEKKGWKKTRCNHQTIFRSARCSMVRRPPPSKAGPIGLWRLLGCCTRFCSDRAGAS